MKATDVTPADDAQSSPSHFLDTKGLICPEPVMLLHKAIRNAESGEVIAISATDPATTRDIPNFCRHLGHELLEQTQVSDEDGNAGNNDSVVYHYLVQKKPH